MYNMYKFGIVTQYAKLGHRSVAFTSMHAKGVHPNEYSCTFFITELYWARNLYLVNERQT